MTHASVFSGIGGPEVAATMLGWDNLFHCEINPFGRAVLDYWYPNAKSYDDITKTDFSEWRGKIDVLTGGFPCQPFSYAGQRRGAEDDRYLWPYMFKCIDTIRPTWVVAENVAGILTMVEQGEVSPVESQGSLFAEDDYIRRYRYRGTFTLERICDDLEGHGYAVQPVLVPACAVGAPHRRDRVFIVGRRRDDGDAADTTDERAGQQQQPRSRECGEPSLSKLRECHGEETASGRITGPLPQDPLRSRQLHGQHDQQGHQRNERHTGAGSGERLCNQIQGSAPTHTASLRRGSDDRGNRQERPSRTCGQHIPQGDTEQRLRSWFRQTGYIWNAADTTDNGLEHAIDNRAERELREALQREGREAELHISTETDGSGLDAWFDTPGARWLNFPTVSPVQIISPIFGGNDGLPFNVDDLAFPFDIGKHEIPIYWRTEALKAYGNAIVPQVIYEIFRAIQITEEQLMLNK